MQFLNEYGLFLLKLISIIVAIVIVLFAIIVIVFKDKIKSTSQLHIHPLHKKFNAYRRVLFEASNDKQQLKLLKKSEKESEKKAKLDKKNRLFVINFHGDIRASQVTALREEVTALLLVATPHDEVLIRLESGGGLVNAYGLAASQLHRIRAANIRLTVAVDKIAASGGYLMACVAHQIIAAPFAIIGSIGVIAQLPNFHRFLKDKHIDIEQFTAGEYKRTVTLFGENTSKGRTKMQEEVNETHELFKDYINQNRPHVPIDQVANGEYWFAQKAIEYNLVDEIQTSDDYLVKFDKTADIFEIEYKIKKPLIQRLTSGGANLWQKCLSLGKVNTGQDYI